MMQETKTAGPWDSLPKEYLPSQSIVTLLALAGSRSLTPDELRRRTKLTQSGFGNLIRWLQREYLIDIVSRLDGMEVREKVRLTEKGEAVLISTLEQTCELPELH